MFDLRMYRYDKSINGLRKKDKQDAGFDIYVEKDTWIWPFKVTKVPANVAIELPQNIFNCGYVTSRSGMSTKGVFIIPGVIDIGYRGQISCIATRIGLLPKKIKKGDRIAQMLVIPLLNVEINEVNSKEEFSDSKRGDKGFGSSGIN